MPYALRTFRCCDCELLCQRRRPAGAEVRCARCAIAYAAEVNRQLNAHEGPAFERWAWAWSTAIRRMARESPPVEVRRTA